MEVIKNEKINTITIKNGNDYIRYSSDKYHNYYIARALIDDTLFISTFGDPWHTLKKDGKGRVKKATLEKMEIMKKWAKENIFNA